jgi:hypothetical protein
MQAVENKKGAGLSRAISPAPFIKRADYMPAVTSAFQYFSTSETTLAGIGT